jgi:3-deoxy-manno-octulosonate cytidylyltransferase (CMP-KDO synthetase)
MAGSDVLVLIPARMAASRFPGKPLADIDGVPMIVHVWRRAVAAAVGRVAVATDSPEIVDAVCKVGGEAVMTSADHDNGTSRIEEAARRLDPDGVFAAVVNVQGDLPTVAPEAIRASLTPLEEEGVDIATIAALISREEEKTDPNVVKVVGSPIAPDRLRALYFTRATAPWGEGPLYHHIGLYAYRRTALSRYVALPTSPLEARERLEQLRALEAGMRIDVAVVDTVPLGVDTPADIDRARAILAGEVGNMRVR